MTSTRTINRQRKVALLKSVLNATIDLLLLDNVVRDKINMSEFKQLDAKVKAMYESIKPWLKNYTIMSKKSQGIKLSLEDDL